MTCNKNFKAVLVSNLGISSNFIVNMKLTEEIERIEKNSLLTLGSVFL